MQRTSERRRLLRDDTVLPPNVTSEVRKNRRLLQSLVVATIVILALITGIFILSYETRVRVTGSSSSDSNSVVQSVVSVDCSWCTELETALTAARGALASTPCKPLSQSNFSTGTVFLTDSGCYRLTEDIVFEPVPDNDYRATREPYASIAAFRLGFFAAIAINGSSILLDLNTHEIRQSDAHALQQRFFAVIEVADRPFITGQGPADFTGAATAHEVVAGKNVVIRNGRIGRSSHHGIHGNNNDRLLIEDLTFKDYEVAAISLNGATHTVVRRVHMLGTFQRVPVLATYSSARFMLPFVDDVLATAPASASKTQLETARATLDALMSQTFEDVIVEKARTGGHINATAHPAAASLFGNPSGLIDGTPYGIVLHARGVAVNGFQCDRTEAQHDSLHHVLIKEAHIEKTVGAVDEVIALRRIEGDNKPQRGPAGDLLQIERIMNLETGVYEATALSEVKILLAKVAATLSPSSSVNVGTLHIDADVISWRDTPSATLAVGHGEGATYEYVRNGDAMFHVNKGAFGVRVGGGHHIALQRVSVDGVENRGTAGLVSKLYGETHEGAYYLGASDGGHPGQEPQSGYGGGDARGISVEAATDVTMDSISVRGVYSALFWSFGVDIFNDASTVAMHDTLIYNVSSFTSQSAMNVDSPKGPMAIGLHSTTAALKPQLTGTLDIQDIVCHFVGVSAQTLYEDSPIEGCGSGAVSNFYGM